jgi:hypothetical protein
VNGRPIDPLVACVIAFGIGLVFARFVDWSGHGYPRW